MLSRYGQVFRTHVTRLVGWRKHVIIPPAPGQSQNQTTLVITALSVSDNNSRGEQCIVKCQRRSSRGEQCILNVRKEDNHGEQCMVN